ncbi:hypothetical protein TanjilG_29852 [Lupinus angustifolius]|uniref:Uncharacterized protein n=1 Tax=Lupinus angustifolius TaxID=3871 RepID=A0A4P1RAA2_LUPAN|nr:hypothetical protein TanjilG_29852 [Lupinus angustifolius]
MSILVTRRTIYQVVRIRALNPRGRWTIINGVYVFDSLYINHGYNYGRVSRMNTTPYMYHSNNNDDGDSWMNTTPYMDHDNNNNNSNNGRVSRVTPAPEDSIENLESWIRSNSHALLSCLS